MCGCGSFVNTESSVIRTPSAYSTVALLPSFVLMPSRMLTR